MTDSSWKTNKWDVMCTQHALYIVIISDCKVWMVMIHEFWCSAWLHHWKWSRWHTWLLLTRKSTASPSKWKKSINDSFNKSDDYWVMRYRKEVHFITQYNGFCSSSLPGISCLCQSCCAAKLHMQASWLRCPDEVFFCFHTSSTAQNQVVDSITQACVLPICIMWGGSVKTQSGHSRLC